MMHKSLNDLEASFSVIVSNIRDYYTKNKHAYRPVAVELRKLLCDTSRGSDVSLLKRIFPDFRLKPLRGLQEKMDKHTVLYIPGVIYSDGKGVAKVFELINENAESLPIDAWLKQRVVDSSTTMHDLIRSVADKEGAHSDKTYNGVLTKTKTVKLSENWSLCDQFIIVVARYIIKSVAIYMLNKDIREVSKYIKEQYEKVGRGGAVLDLFTFGFNMSVGVPLEYKDKTSFIAMFKEGAERQKVVTFVDSYSSNDVFLLAVIDINGEQWLYEQRLNF